MSTPFKVKLMAFWLLIFISKLTLPFCKISNCLMRRKTLLSFEDKILDSFLFLLDFQGKYLIFPYHFFTLQKNMWILLTSLCNLLHFSHLLHFSPPHSSITILPPSLCGRILTWALEDTSRKLRRHPFNPIFHYFVALFLELWEPFQWDIEREEDEKSV